MAVRAKFQVVSITEHHGNASKTVRLEPRYDHTIPEDQRFYDATPWGHFEMMINNPAAADQLKNGTVFYIDLTPATE